LRMLAGRDLWLLRAPCFKVGFGLLGTSSWIWAALCSQTLHHTDGGMESGSWLFCLLDTLL